MILVSIVSKLFVRASPADTSKFGYKMLQKMGWKEGSGLGKNEDGMKTHIHVKKKIDGLGLGADAPDTLGRQGWSDTSKSFGDVLASLSSAYGGTVTKSKKKASSEKKNSRL